mmetsp:Transcript_2975/g.5239  ORF Transcript_2975/g.5239 Transcript_2975/m.5239 type:complete len:208 (-) Transcript_2975:554-1177(-)
MVFYFKVCEEEYVVYMGKDKYENEELIKHAFPCDVWFHVDKLSSAHVYLRLRENETLDDVSDDVIEDLAQLTKYNSIEGNKRNHIAIVYTMASNLKKTGDMEVGQVSFKNTKEVKHYKVDYKKNDVVNRLNKTKVERYPDLFNEKQEYLKQVARKAKNEATERRKKEIEEEEKRKKEKEARDYKLLLDDDLLTTNKDIGDNYEDDFM